MLVYKPSVCGIGKQILRRVPFNSCRQCISSIIFMRQLMMDNKLLVERHYYQLIWRQEVLVHFCINRRNKVPAEVC